MKISAVDLFCGAGGLTTGFERSKIKVVEGVDLDGDCHFPYQSNTSAKFVHRNVTEYGTKDLERAFKGAQVRVLAGCAPCQPFSTYTQSQRGNSRGKWLLLRHFGQLAVQNRPEIVSMENVRPLANNREFRKFVRQLEDSGYFVEFSIADCRSYGIPQQRRRLVLLASRLGPISLIEPTHSVDEDWATVRDFIGHLPKLKAGGTNRHDAMHTASALSDLNLSRIQASKPGGTWRDWPEELVADCHRRDTGRTYSGVYGRMEWDKPSPTITGQAFGFGNGRFGHPKQDRALSLREAALLQTFPVEYKFVPEGETLSRKSVGRMIGNAVPPRLGEVIGRSIVEHIDNLPSGKKNALAKRK